MWVEGDWEGYQFNLEQFEALYLNDYGKGTRGTYFIEINRNFAKENQDGIRILAVDDEAEGYAVLDKLREYREQGRAFVSLLETLALIRGEKAAQEPS